MYIIRCARSIYIIIFLRNRLGVLHVYILYILFILYDVEHSIRFRVPDLYPTTTRIYIILLLLLLYPSVIRLVQTIYIDYMLYIYHCIQWLIANRNKCAANVMLYEYLHLYSYSINYRHYHVYCAFSHIELAFKREITKDLQLYHRINRVQYLHNVCII